MSGSVKRLLVYFVAIVCCVSLAATWVLAASTGQIKGKVLDKDKKEPVVGASVRIAGTKIGAMTDPDGNFQILRVEPGDYTLEVSAVGYQKMEISGVQVTADYTKEVSVSLPTAVTELQDVIKVTATHDILNKFETSNQSTITAQTIKTRPVQTVDNLLKSVAGVQTTAAGQVFIRGGRAGEVAYIVDGVPVGDPLGGVAGTGINLSLASGSIQEVQIIKDGFDPEYGNALSGIVKITTPTGNKDNTKINLQYITDDFGTRSLNKYSKNYDYMRFSISGPDPILKNRILPSLGLKFLEDKEFTYYVYGEVEKWNGDYPYTEFDSPATRHTYGTTGLFGIDIPNKRLNRYYFITNLKFRPKQNLKFILSYKNGESRNGLFASSTGGSWEHRYAMSTAPVVHSRWQSLSMEVSQELSKNMSYEGVLSFYEKRDKQKPGDPNNPLKGLDPDDFLLDSMWESYDDLNSNSMYDAPEPLINLYPDSMAYGTNTSGPKYTFSEYPTDTTVIQNGQVVPVRFRFNDNGVRDSLEGEPYLDLNGNGVWDRGDYLHDKNGNGILDADRVSPINRHTPEPYTDGDSILGEPYTDLNVNGRYDHGVDLFIKSVDPATNQDLNRNGQHDGPENTLPFEWEPGIPYMDRNSNSVYDFPNGRFDPGEPYLDVNGNGTYDYGSASSFLNPGTYNVDIVWQDNITRTYRGELKLYRQMGPHELKLGGMVSRDVFSYAQIKRAYIAYVGRYDGGPYSDRGAFRDVFEYKPWNGTLYFHDKIEYGTMIAMLGLRWDFFLQDVNQLVPIVQSDDLGGAGVILGDRQRLSPRIGFSYPISDKAKVHFNYGHFYQLPEYRYMFARNTVNIDQNDVVGNFNLDYMKTVQYSFGVKYAMTESYTLDLSGYFKDEFDKINQQLVTLARRRVNQYRNRDYGRSRGFELTLEKRGGGYVGGEISYAYAFAYGKASQTSEDYLTEFQLSRDPLSESPLDNDIRHSLKAGIQVYIPGSVKPRLFGLPIPNGWTLAIQAIIESGKPFTPSSRYPGIVATTGETIATNSLRYPATAVFDIRLSKEFKVVGLDYSVVLDVRNVLNSRNVTGVYSATGRADTQQNLNGVVYAGTPEDQNPYNWDYGRQVRLGLEVNL